MFIKKVLRTIKKKYIRIFEYFNTSKYMKKYVKFLKKNQMNIIGMPRYIHPSVYFDGKDYSIIEIGDRCVLSKEVVLLTHDYSIARGLEAINKHNPDMSRDEFLLKGIKIGKNVFVGYRAIILPGSEIGENCIIGAAAVVKGKVPSNSIVIGNPSRIIAKTDEWALRKINENEFKVEEKY